MYRLSGLLCGFTWVLETWLERAVAEPSWQSDEVRLLSLCPENITSSDGTRLLKERLGDLTPQVSPGDVQSACYRFFCLVLEALLYKVFPVNGLTIVSYNFCNITAPFQVHQTLLAVVEHVKRQMLEEILRRKNEGIHVINLD
jgi:hypothetical protein